MRRAGQHLQRRLTAGVSPCLLEYVDPTWNGTSTAAMEDLDCEPTAMTGPDHFWSAQAAAFTRCDLGGDYPPWDRLAASQLAGPRRGPNDHTEPAAADIPAIDADVDSGEFIAAQLPQVLVMHDAGHGSQVGSRSREPSRGNQDLGRGEHAHADSMGTCGAR